MSTVIAIVGVDVERPLSMLRYVMDNNQLEIEIKGIRYDSYIVDFLDIQPDIVVYVDFMYKYEKAFKDIWIRFGDKKILLNADNEYLFEQLALVDEKEKLSYSVRIPWRTYHIGEVDLDERGYKGEFYSPKSSRGFKLYGIDKEEELENILLVLSVCEMIGIDAYTAANRLREYYDITL